MKKTATLFCVTLAGLMLAMPLHAADAKGKLQEKVAMNPGMQQSGGKPSDVVRTFYGSLVNVMKQGDSLQFQGRYEKLKAPIQHAFDMHDMMRTAAGAAWVKASPDQQAQLVSAFRDFSVANYASQFKSYGGEKFEVAGEKPQSNGNVLVETKLSNSGESHDINYLMHKTGQGWQIVDVYVNGSISEMASRRSEFGSILRTSGPSALVDMLGQKSKAMSES